MARTAAWLMVAAWGLAAMRLLASSGETGVGDSSGDEFHVVERKSLEYRHELRVTAMTEKSEKIVNPLRWLPLEYFVPDGAEVRKGDLIARFNQTSSRHDEKSQSMELAVVEAELQRRLTAIDNRNLEMDESLGDLQDKLASLEAKLTRLLSEPNQDDIRIAEGKLKLADLNLRLAASDFRRAEGRFRRGMISRAELDSTEKTLRENEVKHEFAVCELELTLAPIALPYDIERTRLQIANARLEIEKLQSEIAEQSKLSEIQKRGASQRRKRTLNELKNTRRDIENAEMRAPIDGFISHRRIDGNELKLGMRLWNNVTFMEIPDLQTIGFQGVLLESARKHFEKGDRVVVRLQGKLTREIECRLESISTLSHDISEKGNTSSNQNRKYGVNVFDVTIRFGAGTEGVRPGMTGIAEIIASRPLEGPAVPLKFMRYEEGRHYIIVDGILEEVTGTACGGWFVLDDAKWLGVRVGMRGEHRRADGTGDSGKSEGFPALLPGCAPSKQPFFFGFAVGGGERPAECRQKRTNKFRRHLNKHEENADFHRYLNRRHVRSPDRVVYLLRHHRIGATVPPAQKHHGKIEQDKKRGRRVDYRLRARFPVGVEKIHQHMSILLKRPPRAENIIGSYGELRRLERPDGADFAAARKHGEHQHGQYYQQQIHRGDAEPSDEELDTAHVFDQHVHNQ